MKQLSLILIFMCLFIGCKHVGETYNDTICDVDCITDSILSPSIKDDYTPNSVNGKNAIGNLKFGISRSEFEKARKIFLKEYLSIADMQIEDVKAIFDNNLLICIIIHSKGTVLRKPDIYSPSANSNRKIIDLYDSKYSQYRNGSGKYLKDGISYTIILQNYYTPKMMYDMLTNHLDDDQKLLSRLNFKSKDIPFYTAYDYIIISNKVYMDSLQNKYEKTMREIESQKSQRDLDAI